MVGSIKAGVMSNPMFIKRPRNVRNLKGVRIRAALRAAAGEAGPLPPHARMQSDDPQKNKADIKK